MKPISIYIVEDELLISASLKSQLQGFGYEITGSSIRGETCLEEIARLSQQGREPEIVLMDIHLRGELDGIDTARLINEKFNCAIIFLTGQSSKEIYERSFKIKPFGYLLKPIDMEQTKMTIEIASYQRNLEIENNLYQKDLEALLEKRSQEIRELVAMYQTIVENAQTGLSIMQDGRFVFANQRTADLFGLPVRDFLALTPDEIRNAIFSDDRERIALLTQASDPENRQPLHFRVRIQAPGNRLTHVEVSAQPVEFKERPALHVTFQDITEFSGT